MLTLSKILEAQNGYKPAGSEQGQSDAIGSIMGGIQNGIQLHDILKKAGILGGTGATGAEGAAVSAVPPVV